MQVRFFRTGLGLGLGFFEEDLDLDLDLRTMDLDLHLDLTVAGLVTSLVLKLNFGFPNLRERGRLWGWAFVVSDGASVTSC